MIKSDSKWGAYNVSRKNMWGTYCPETKEYYLAHNTYLPEVGECVEVLASAHFVRDDEWQAACGCGYEDYNGGYEVVRELLQLGHLTPKTLASFIEADGEVWWDQPNFSKEVEEK